MQDAFTIRIFVPNGNPDGLRIIDDHNWTGQAVVFPRDEWPQTKALKELGLSSSPGVYILVGFEDDSEDRHRLYIGESDNVENRLNSHVKHKDFWYWCIVFVSTKGSLNKAHAKWLEYALVKKANETNRSIVENGNAPNEPSLSMADKADSNVFLKKIYQILPLVGLRSFEEERTIRPQEISAPQQRVSDKDQDTIIIPAKPEGFQMAFIGSNAWWAIRIHKDRLEKLRYIAAYQVRPISAVTHLAEIERIEPYGDNGKYKVFFKQPAKEIPHITLGNASGSLMQAIRYTNVAKFETAKTLPELF